MAWIPSVEYIETLFEGQIKAGHLINRQGLISTLDKVKWGVPFQDAPTIWDQVTILCKEIKENHYFSDGNKRIGALLAYIFLFKNGYEFSPIEDEIYSITMNVAQGLIEFEKLKEWFNKNSRKIK